MQREHEEFNQLRGDLTGEAKAKIQCAEQLVAAAGTGGGDLAGDSFAEMLDNAKKHIRAATP